MNKGEGWYSGASSVPDTYANLVGQNQKSRISITPLASLPVKQTISFAGGNGFVLPELASTDLHLVADDLSAGSDWNSRVGAWVAAHTGSPTVGMESPLYPDGTFAGVGYRTGVADFTTSKYYKIPYNIAHALTSSSTITYEALIQVGVIANEETYFGRYITASTKYNLRLYSKNDGFNNYLLYVEVDHATSNAICTRIVTQSSIVLVTFKYDGASQTLSMYLNGVPVTTSGPNIGTSTGTGSIINDTSTDFFIGLSDTAIGKPLIKGRLLEIARHTTLLSDTTILQRFQSMVGVVLADGTYPSIANFRNSFGYLPVNKKLWAFSINWPMISEKGAFAPDACTCTMNNTAITDGSGGSSGLTISAGVSLINEAGSFNSQINGQTVTIPYDGSSRTAKWVNAGLTQSTNSSATVVWRGINSATAYLYIYDETTTKYWVSGSTWSASPTAIDLSSFIKSGSGTLVDPYTSNVPFTTEAFGAGNHAIDCIVHNNSLLDASKSINIYHCQSVSSGQLAAEPLMAIHPTGGDSFVYLSTTFQYPVGIINYKVGQINYDFYPIYSSTQPRLSPSNAQTMLSGSTGINYHRVAIGTSTFTFADNSLHTVDLAPSFNNYDLIQFQLNWNNGNNKMSERVTNKASSGAATFTSPLSSGDFRLGSSSQSPGGYFKNIVIRGI